MKTRVIISKKYRNKNLYLAFRVRSNDPWYLLLHDELVNIVKETTPWLQSLSWTKDGLYSTDRPSRQMLERLSDYAL